MKDDDLYARCQTLTALIGVLLHDLRNPLHSATLLVEAMGTRSADIDTLRGKLRGQFGKLEGIISDASSSIKELAFEPRIEDLSIDDLLRTVAASAPTLSGCDLELTVPSTPPLRVSADRTLLVRAVAEIAATISMRSGGDGTQRVTIPLAVEQPDATAVRVILGGWVAPLDDAAVKAPFAIAGGGIRLALARALSQMAGAALRLEQSDQGAIRYALHLRRVN